MFIFAYLRECRTSCRRIPVPTAIATFPDWLPPRVLRPGNKRRLASHVYAAARGSRRSIDWQILRLQRLSIASWGGRFITFGVFALIVDEAQVVRTVFGFHPKDFRVRR